MVGSFHLITVKEAETHCHEIISNAEQQFYIFQSADQLILCNQNTFEPEGVKIHEEISGTSKRDFSGKHSQRGRQAVQKKTRNSMAPRESQERVKPSKQDDCRHGRPDGGLLDPPSLPPFQHP